MNIPEGWQLVPVELTAENGMKAALMGEFRVSTAIGDFIVPWDTIKKIHRAMVAAAPTPPEDEPISDESPEEIRASYRRMIEAMKKSEAEDDELRKAAGEALGLLNEYVPENNRIVANLIKALDKGKSC